MRGAVFGLCGAALCVGLCVGLCVSVTVQVRCTPYAWAVIRATGPCLSAPWGLVEYLVTFLCFFALPLCHRVAVRLLPLGMRDAVYLLLVRAGRR